MDYAALFQFIFQMTPIVIALIKQAEAVIPGPGKGKLKLDLVLDSAASVAQVSSVIMPGVVAIIDPTVMRSALEPVVSAQVAALNRAGALSTPASIPPAAHR